MRGKFEINWIRRGGPPQGSPNAAYPEGCYIDLTASARAEGKVKRATPPPDRLIEMSCSTPLPYPTGRQEVGGWLVRCTVCDLTCFVSAASRPDDPRGVQVTCKDRQP